MANDRFFSSHFLTTNPSPIAIPVQDDQSQIFLIPLSNTKPLTCARWPVPQLWLSLCKMTSSSTMAVLVQDDQSHILPIPLSDNKPLTYGCPWAQWPITHPSHSTFWQQAPHLWPSLRKMTLWLFTTVFKNLTCCPHLSQDRRCSWWMWFPLSRHLLWQPPHQTSCCHQLKEGNASLSEGRCWPDEWNPVDVAKKTQNCHHLGFTGLCHKTLTPAWTSRLLKMLLSAA